MRTRLRASAHAAWLLVVLYLCWPAPESPLLTGIPLQTPTLVGLGVLAWCVTFGRALTPRWTVYATAVLLVLRVGLDAGTLPRGWQAWYYATPDLTGSAERSIDFRRARYTRIDRELDFIGDQFPLHFLNELRFNMADWKRVPAFSVRWLGFTHTATADEIEIDVEWTNRVQVFLDSHELFDQATPPQTIARRTARVRLEPGDHLVQVRYYTRNYEPARLRVGVEHADRSTAGRADGPIIMPERFTPTGLRISDLARAGLLVCDLAMLLGILAWAGVTARHVARMPGRVSSAMWGAHLMGPALVLGVCLLPAAVSIRWDRPATAMINVASGTDGLTYEDYAREAILHGPSLNTGHIKGRPYEYTIGYHYFVSLAHLALGESIFNVFQANECLLLLAIVLNTLVAGRLAGQRAALVCAAMGVYCFVAVFWLRTYTFKENLIVLMNALLATVLSRPGPFSSRYAALIGAVAGINCLTDPINLAILPVVFGLVWWNAPVERRARIAGVTVAACAACLLIVALRNVIVTGFPTPLPTEGRSALWFGNQPPPEVFPGPVAERHLEAVLAYIRAEPQLFIAGLIDKGLHAVGLYFMRFRTTDWTEVFSPVMLIAWIGFFVGLGRALRIAPWSSIISAMGLIRGAVMVVFVSYMDVDRYELPWLVAVTPLLAATTVWLWQWSRVAVVALLIVIGGWDFYRVFPSLCHVPFAASRALWPATYAAQRRDLAAVNSFHQWDSTFPKDLPSWKPGERVMPVALDDRVFCLLSAPGGGGMYMSTGGGVRAPLVKSIRVHGGFAGWWHYASIRWRRHGDDRLFWANFPIDKTGRIKEYEVPVPRSADWYGMIDEVGIFYWGEQFTVKSFHLVRYGN